MSRVFAIFVSWVSLLIITKEFLSYLCGDLMSVTDQNEKLIYFIDYRIIPNIYGASEMSISN